jgi:branched-chain amino acid transport system ATP-binding protein
MNALTLSDVGVTYRGMSALAGVSLAIETGEMLGIAGPNGAGKTSLLRAISGLAPLARGRVTFEGQILGDAAARVRQSVRRIVLSGLCLVPEGRRLFAGLSVEDHLRLGAYLVSRREVESGLAYVYGIFPKLAERRHQDVATLSGGEKQMVAIGRALMSQPRLLMIDELSLGLAPVIVNELIDALADLNRAIGLTVILVDECLNRLGSTVSRVVFLSHGQVRAIRSPEDLSKDAATLYLSQD